MEEVAFLWLFNLRERSGGPDVDMVRGEHGIMVQRCDAPASIGPLRSHPGWMWLWAAWSGGWRPCT